MRGLLILRPKRLVIVPALVNILGNKNPSTENEVNRRGRIGEVRRQLNKVSLMLRHLFGTRNN